MIGAFLASSVVFARLVMEKLSTAFRSCNVGEAVDAVQPGEQSGVQPGGQRE